MEQERTPSFYASIILMVLALVAIFYFITNSMEKEKDLTSQASAPLSKTVGGAIIKTNYGDITVEFYNNDAPVTVGNFIKLAESGFYDGTKMHRVIEGFMIQGGDPLSKDDSKEAMWGTGGPGYKFNDEIGDFSHNAYGTIAMANSGPNTNGSQFFVNVADNDFLDGGYTVFGKVVAGMDVVEKISKVETKLNPYGNEKSAPVKSVIVEKVTVK